MSKPTCEGCPSVDIRAWAAEGLLEPGNRWIAEVFRGDKAAGTITVVSEESAVVLDYYFPGKGGDTAVNERVEIDWTTPNLGGRRPWFLCPGCELRRARLYSRGGRFRCRTCHGLAYASQRVGPSRRPPKEGLGHEAGPASCDGLPGGVSHGTVGGSPGDYLGAAGGSSF